MFFRQQIPVYLFGDAKCMMWSKRTVMLLVWRDVNIIMLLISLMKFLRIWILSNIFQELQDFLIFADSLTIYITSRNSQPKFPRKNIDGRFPDQGNVHPQNHWNWKYSCGPFSADFCSLEGICRFISLPFRHLHQNAIFHKNEKSILL